MRRKHRVRYTVEVDRYWWEPLTRKWVSMNAPRTGDRYSLREVKTFKRAIGIAQAANRETGCRVIVAREFYDRGQRYFRDFIFDARLSSEPESAESKAIRRIRSPISEDDWEVVRKPGDKVDIQAIRERVNLQINPAKTPETSP